MEDSTELKWTVMVDAEFAHILMLELEFLAARHVKKLRALELRIDGQVVRKSAEGWTFGEEQK